MRIIKALLVLVFLLPTLAAAQPTPESFIRIERDENREPVALQTVIAKYVPVGSATGVEIDLVAVVHIGEQAYYRRLNREFQKYDAVLYELVAPEGTRPTRGGERSDNPLAMLQQPEACPAVGTSAGGRGLWEDQLHPRRLVPGWVEEGDEGPR